MREIVSLFRGRRQRDHRLASSARAAPRMKSSCPPKPLINLSAHRVRHRLPGQVDFDRRIDRHHIVVLRDDEGIVGIAVGLKLKQRIVVHVLVPFAGAQRKSQHNLVGIDLLSGPGDHALFDQRNYTFRQRLGVDAQILVVAQDKAESRRELCRCRFAQHAPSLISPAT